MLRRLLIAAAVLVGLLALVWIAGLFVPRHHVATSRAVYRQPPEALWTAITDHASAPSWREDLRSVERAPDRDGHPVWVEVSKLGRMPLEVVKAEVPRRYVTRIADEDLPFGGTWTFEIEPADGGSELTITEKGEVKSALFRVMARFALGYHSTMDAYLRALGRRFGEEVEPVHVYS